MRALPDLNACAQAIVHLYTAGAETLYRSEQTQAKTNKQPVCS